MLVIEDDADTRHLLADILVARGYQVDTALDGTQALARLNQQAPDLVTLDLNMPILDGRQVLERMRTTSGCTHIPVLILSGALESPQWIRSYKAAGYLSKPFTLEALTRAVESLAPNRPSILPRRD